jgi:hypothetical protein
MKRLYLSVWGFTFLILLSFPTAGCNDESGITHPESHDLGLSHDLHSNCYGWPEHEFSPQNVAALEAALPVGSKAVEFSLEDLDGNVTRLSTLLKSKPVLLVLGSFT